MFTYCLNNPVNHVDKNGTNPVALQWWISTMCWLPAADAILIIGDVIYYGGIAILDISTLYTFAQTVPEVSLEEKEEAEPEPPDVTYPGDDPTKAPEGTKWKGKGEQGSKQGNYYDPEKDMSWHPDLDHPEPIGPHWDLKDSAGIWWRIAKGSGGETLITLK